MIENNTPSERLLDVTTEELIKEICARSEAFVLAVQMPSNEGEVAFACSPHPETVLMAKDMTRRTYYSVKASMLVDEYLEDNPDLNPTDAEVEQLFMQAFREISNEDPRI